MIIIVIDNFVMVNGYIYNMNIKKKNSCFREGTEIILFMDIIVLVQILLFYVAKTKTV